MLLYALLLGALRHIGTAEPSFAGEVFPWVERITREQIQRRHPAASAQYLAVIAALFALYGLAVWRLARRSSDALERIAFLAGVGFLVLQTSSPVMLSTDIYAYAMYGRIFSIYGGDAYVPARGSYADDPFMPLSYFLPWPSWYGPLWTLLCGAITRLTGEQVGLTVLMFRLLAIGGTLAAGGLVWACLRRWRPERAAQGIVFLLWNPLVVLESGLSGHNDGIMAALMLLGIWLALRGGSVLPWVGFTLSAVLKFVTGLILPLWVVLSLRAPGTRAARLRRIAAGGAISLGLAALLFAAVGGGTSLPVAKSAGAAYFYDNNLYQVLLPRLRRWLGEDSEAVKVPPHFYSWWSETREPTVLESAPGPNARDVESVKAGTKLLVIAPLDAGWVRVYNPSSRRVGYTREADLEKIDRPEFANHDPSIWEHERNPATGPIAARANAIIRAVTWLLFVAIGALVAWRVRDERSWIVGSTAAFLAVYWLVATEIWPWYVIWSLALGALVVDSRPALLSAMLSASVLTLYVTIGFERSAHSWLFAYRSLPAFALPLVLFGAVLALQASRRRARVRPGRTLGKWRMPEPAA